MKKYWKWNYSVFDENGKQVIQDVSFSLKKGEILGFSGLIGAGGQNYLLVCLADLREKKREQS